MLRSVGRASTIMKNETERDNWHATKAFGRLCTMARNSLIGAAALTVMAAAAASTQANAQLFVGLQEAGFNGAAITIYPTGSNPGGAYGTFGVRDKSGHCCYPGSGDLPIFNQLLGTTIDVADSPGTLVVWMTTNGHMALPSL